MDWGIMDGVKEEIVHIFVIGFHHKKGCQLEYSYPHLDAFPEPWKHLSTLAMPDGAHNYDNDTVYYHLPSLDDPPRTLFGVSCFQQVAIEKVTNRTADMTRGAVQKAVCILSTVPLYGYLQVKLELVTAAFFDKGDFSQVSILKDAFHHLNDCLPGTQAQHLHDGLCVRDLVTKFRHRTLLLFKLMLLERRVVFFHSPVEPLVATLLSLVSLHPGLIQTGLYQAASTSRHSRDELDARKEGKTPSRAEPGSPETHEEEPEMDGNARVNGLESRASGDAPGGKQVQSNLSEAETVIISDNGETERRESERNEMNRELGGERGEMGEGGERGEVGEGEEGLDALLIEDYFSYENPRGSGNLRRNDSLETLRSDCPPSCDVTLLASLDQSGCGLPLPLFTEGNLFLPYLSISYLDYLTSSGVRGFHVGATNVLFKQKRHLADVLVDLETGRIETHCPELRRQLVLSTEDLRFAEQLVRGVGEGREGGEEWVRAQFTLYLLSMLRTSLLPEGSREMDNFNPVFMSAWLNTLSYNMWLDSSHDVIWELNPGHPCAGNLSVSDMRLRLSQVMSSSESGRRLNQAVSTTGKAVGGAISQAKGALSSWWSNLTTPETKTNGKTIENI